jgi:hypothetical protein
MPPPAARRPLDPRRARAANREAQARWRARQKACAASYRVDANDRVLTMLVFRKYLDDAETGNERAVAEAISVFMADHADLDEQ